MKRWPSRAEGVRTIRAFRVAVTALGCLAAARAFLSPPVQANAGNANMTEENAVADHPYVGMWATDDGHIRHELLPNGRYDEARGTRESAYRGRYEVDGAHIEYWDDTGFTADGDFVDVNVAPWRHDPEAPQAMSAITALPTPIADKRDLPRRKN